MQTITRETNPELTQLIALYEIFGETLTTAELARIEERVAADEARIAAEKAQEAARAERARLEALDKLQRSSLRYDLHLLRRLGAA